jgi:putative iron-regulated protein
MTLTLTRSNAAPFESGNVLSWQLCALATARGATTRTIELRSSTIMLATSRVIASCKSHALTFEMQEITRSHHTIEQRRSNHEGHMESHRASSLTVFYVLCALACGGEDAAVSPGNTGNTNDTNDTLPANTADAVSTYAEVVYASYRDSLSTARALDEAAAALVSAPSDAALDAARDAWRAAREPYLQTEVYRFYGGPIDAEESGPEGLINAWPLDEGHIDYVEGDLEAGIINDPQIVIDAATLVSANLNPGETDVATGYHAIEFLLWGQDFNPEGAGQRPFSDYMPGTTPAQANAARRGQYLTTASEMLVGHLEQLTSEWEPAATNYRATLEASAPADALSNILSGMIILSGFELASERLSAALDAQDQEEEHSCFSDNTHRDMVQDIRGLANVWTGSYAPVTGAPISGTSIQAVISARDADLAAAITRQITESSNLAAALQAPFDREIASDNAAGNARVEALIESLFTQSELLEQALEVYGLNRIPDPT